MNTDIQFLYKYQAGPKFYDGFFPVFNLNGDISCKVEQIKQKRLRNNVYLDEGIPDILIGYETPDGEPVEIILTFNQVDYNIYI